MSASVEKLSALRHLLAERFPSSQRMPAGRALRIGLPAVDETCGGLPLSAVTELVCAAPSCGSHLFLQQILTTTRLAQSRLALVDANDSFDPSSFPHDLLAHIVWVRGRNTADALQAADLLARDANLGLVVLDLRRAPEAELRRIPAPQWYRLQRAVEPTDLALLVQTPRPSVPSAQFRLVLDTSHTITALERQRPALATELTPLLQRQRLHAATG